MWLFTAFIQTIVYTFTAAGVLLFCPESFTAFLLIMLMSNMRFEHHFLPYQYARLRVHIYTLVQIGQNYTCIDWPLSIHWSRELPLVAVHSRPQYNCNISNANFGSLEDHDAVKGLLLLNPSNTIHTECVLVYMYRGGGGADSIPHMLKIHQ